jgi:CheY-like chemotaxis protein
LKPELVLLDVTMPEMNGLAAARMIRQQEPDTGNAAGVRLLGFARRLEGRA